MRFYSAAETQGMTRTECGAWSTHLCGVVGFPGPFFVDRFSFFTPGPFLHLLFMCHLLFRNGYDSFVLVGLPDAITHDVVYGSPRSPQTSESIGKENIGVNRPATPSGCGLALAAAKLAISVPTHRAVLWHGARVIAIGRVTS